MDHAVGEITVVRIFRIVGDTGIASGEELTVCGDQPLNPVGSSFVDVIGTLELHMGINVECRGARDHQNGGRQHPGGEQQAEYRDQSGTGFGMLSADSFFHRFLTVGIAYF